MNYNGTTDVCRFYQRQLLALLVSPPLLLLLLLLLLHPPWKKSLVIKTEQKILPACPLTSQPVTISHHRSPLGVKLVVNWQFPLLSVGPSLTLQKDFGLPQLLATRSIVDPSNSRRDTNKCTSVSKITTRPIARPSQLLPPLLFLPLLYCYYYCHSSIITLKKYQNQKKNLFSWPPLLRPSKAIWSPPIHHPIHYHHNHYMFTVVWYFEIFQQLFSFHVIH